MSVLFYVFQFCRSFVSTVEQCQVAALEKLEADAKLKKQNFGSQSYSPPKTPASSLEAAAESGSSLKKGTIESCDLIILNLAV